MTVVLGLLLLLGAALLWWGRHPCPVSLVEQAPSWTEDYATARQHLSGCPAQPLPPPTCANGETPQWSYYPVPVDTAGDTGGDTGGNTGGDTGGDTGDSSADSGECKSISHVSDSWCQAVKCDPAYADFCSGSMSDSSSSSGSGGDQPQPKPTPTWVASTPVCPLCSFAGGAVTTQPRCVDKKSGFPLEESLCTATKPQPAQTQCPATDNSKCVNAAWVAFQDVKITSATMVNKLSVPDNAPFDTFNMLIGFVALPQEIASGSKTYDITENATFNAVQDRVLCLGGGIYTWKKEDLSEATTASIIAKAQQQGWNGLQYDVEIIDAGLGGDLKRALDQVHASGLYCSVTVYYSPGNQGGAVKSVFSTPGIFDSVDSVMVQLYAGSGRSTSQYNQYAHLWYQQKNIASVSTPYCADGWGLSTCPGPLSATKDKLVWGVALDANGKYVASDYTGLPSVAGYCIWVLSGCSWAPKASGVSADPWYRC